MDDGVGYGGLWGPGRRGIECSLVVGLEFSQTYGAGEDKPTASSSYSSPLPRSR